MQSQILGYLSPAITVIFAVIFVALWWRDRQRRYVLAYAGWFAAVALATAIQAFLVTDFGPIEVVILHLVLTLGAVGMIWGVAKRYEQRIPLLALVLIALVSGAVCALGSVYENQTVYLIAQNTAGGLLFALGAYTVWGSQRRDLGDTLLIAAFVFAASYGLLRPAIIALVQSQMTVEEYQASAMLTTNMVANAIMALFLALALLATIVTDVMQTVKDGNKLDALSGLNARAVFEQEVADMFSRASAMDIPVSLVVADIDHFKAVNDTYGHGEGDRVIASFGRLLRQTIRDWDIGGRVGGEEFCVAVWNCSEREACGLANRIRLALSDTARRGEDKLVRCTASFGVAQWREGESYKALFKRADARLYEAKGAGRNQVCPSTNIDRPDASNVIPLAR